MKALDVKLIIDENATFTDEKGVTKVYTKYEIQYAGANVGISIKPQGKELAKFLFLNKK